MGESIKIRKVGKYFLTKKLGAGTMGSVWLSSHAGLNIPVAVKLLNMDLAAEDQDYLNRFMQEGRLAGQLNHKNIVRIYDAGKEGNCAYLVMEYIEGCDTLELLESRGALPPDEVLALGIAVGQALEEAHSLGIVHRDIKPDNILATNEGKIKLADLGLAKQLDDSFGSTMAGTALGTPFYISPEQALDALKADGRSDIYSLGATLYHLLTGFLPYEGDNVMGVMLRHANEPLTPPQQKKSGLPQGFCDVICKMMEKNPDDRYQTCTEMLEDFNKLKYGSDDISVGEKQLSKHLASGKSCRIRVKIPASGKYSENKSENKSSKKRPLGSGSRKKKNTKKKSNPALYVTLAAVALLLLLLIPSIIKKPARTVVPDTENSVIEEKVEMAENLPALKEGAGGAKPETVKQESPEEVKPSERVVPSVGFPIPHRPPKALISSLRAFAAGNKQEAIQQANLRLYNATDEKIIERLKYIIKLAEGDNPIGAKPSEQALDTKDVYLSDCEWDSGRVGWKEPARNHYVLENATDLKLLLEIDNNFYAKGLYAHTPSRFIYDLDGKWDKFETNFGFRDGGFNKARFTILGDGEVLFTADEIMYKKVYTAKVNVSGIKTLELVTENIKTNAKCWTIWTNPKLSRK